MELTFADSIGGTIKFRYRSSQAFREGFILTTLDGGLTWNKEILEQDDPVWDGSLLQSGAGAKSAATDRPKPDGALKVVWADELAGWATVFQGVCSGGGEAGYTCQSAVVLMATQDGGKTWTQIHP